MWKYNLKTFGSFYKNAANKVIFLKTTTFLTRELRACARASYRYHVGNGIRSIGRFL